MPRTRKRPVRPTLPDCLEERHSTIHGSGIFATRAIPKGTRLIEYVGRKVGKAEALRVAARQMDRHQNQGEGAVYLFELNKRYDLDGNVSWNPARFINHSCRPNCEVNNDRGRRLFISAKRPIAAGEELSYDYGYDPEHFVEHPCRCNAPNCIGYIVMKSQWPRLRKLLSRVVDNTK